MRLRSHVDQFREIVATAAPGSPGRSPPRLPDAGVRPRGEHHRVQGQRLARSPIRSSSSRPSSNACASRCRTLSSILAAEHRLRQSRGRVARGGHRIARIGTHEAVARGGVEPRQARRRHPGTAHPFDHRDGQRSHHPLGHQSRDDRCSRLQQGDAHRDPRDEFAGSPARIPSSWPLPSGTGKTTVCRRVVEAEDRGIVFSVSTPRARSATGSETASTTTSCRRTSSGAWSMRARSWSGRSTTATTTARAGQSIDASLAQGRDVLLEIEVQGARQVRERRDDARLIFLLPPSMKVLKRRLADRGTDSDGAGASGSISRARSSRRSSISITRS